jgi:hypothetical protein
LLFGVTFDPSRGYVETAPELRSPVTALSRGGLSRKIEAAARRSRVRAPSHRHQFPPFGLTKQTIFSS